MTFLPGNKFGYGSKNREKKLCKICGVKIKQRKTFCSIKCLSVYKTGRPTPLRSEEWRRKQSKYRKAHPINYWLGKKRPSPSKETRQKMSRSHTGMKKPWVVKGWNAERKEKLFERLKNQKFRDTDIERRLEQLLKEMKISYQKQVIIPKITVSDFFLQESQVYLFADGDYWHNLQRVKDRDQRNNKLMREQGVKFLRFKGSLINKDLKKVEEKLLLLTR